MTAEVVGDGGGCWALWVGLVRERKGWMEAPFLLPKARTNFVAEVGFFFFFKL